MTPTPEATEAALKEHNCYTQESQRGFLAGAEFGDAQGYARASEEMQAQFNLDIEKIVKLQQEVNQAKGNLDIYKWSMVSTKREWDAEIAQLKKELDSKKNLLKDIYEEWDEPCDSSCDSWAHSPSCKAINIVEAKRAMRLEIAQLKQEVALAKERLGPAGYKILEEHAQLKQANTVLVEALEEIKRGRKLIDSSFSKWTSAEIAEEALAAARKGEA